ncbi:SUKH-4 family immunity protein [Streptomyces sp. NBC_01016]|uniref:SUKH-4 family immunity protein n=1 Tax=Streptomyces sp. NBC_01016 TaxID=2903720 RepID=UPI00224C888A|nr:SUKH-4 family immunity protein [Streptomyces sp. NBC_01016]MCX4827516.1 SUKH-4 family immunity protein [Streptomyces sp. NBC_01016]
MVTFAQAQERAEEWINGEMPAYQHREVRVREFELGFVVWAEDREAGPVSDGGRQRLVIARDSGDASLWPSLPVGEVIRRYEEEYGLPDAPAEPSAPRSPERVDLNQTSFLLTPPEWLQEEADRRSDAPAEPVASAAPGLAKAAASAPADATPADAVPARVDAEPQDAVPPVPVPADATPWAGTDTNGMGDEEDRSVPLPDTVFSPPLAEDAPPPGVTPDAQTARIVGPIPPPPPPPPSDVPVTYANQQAAPDAGAHPPSAPSYGFPPAASDTGSQPPSAPPAPAPSYGFPPAASDTGSQPLSAPPASSYGFPPAASDAGAQPPSAPPAPAPSYGFPPAASDTGSQPPSAPPAPAPSYGFPQAAPDAGSQPPSAPPAPTASYGFPQGAPDAGGQPPSVPPVAPASAERADSYGYPQGAAGASFPPPAPGTAVPGPPPPGASYGYPQDGPGARDAGGRPLPPGAGDIANAATSKAEPPRGGGAQTPPPPGPPGAPAGGYVPTQMMPPPGPDGPPQTPGEPGPPPPPGAPGAPGEGVHHAATMLSGPPPGGPVGQAPPPPPGAPGAPGEGVHHAATMLSGPGPQGPDPSTPPPPPGAPGAPGEGVHHAATMLSGPAPQGPGPGPMPPPAPGQQIPGAPPAAYGYPQPQQRQQPAQPAGQPTVGPGYQAVLRYRAPDGSEQQLIRRSAPGTPHPEWQIFHELRGMSVPPDQVLELHTELESCSLPGAYCSRMIQEQWPQARITSIAPYGTDHASRQQGMQQLLAHQGELHQVADGPARPAPVRAPLQPAHPAPPVPPEAIAQELAAAFGPGVFRFDQRAVSRQGVPDTVAHTLVVAGLPSDFGPFFWAQAQPGRPVPTLAELAQERGVQAASDAGSYLVMGSDFGKALCVQYGTANIVAVPVEAGPDGAPAPPQFVNSGLPEFARSIALLGRMWRLRFGLNQEQAGRWTVDFQAELSAIDSAALGSPETWWSVLLEQMWDGLL